MNRPGDVAFYNGALYQFRNSWGSTDSQTVYRWEKVSDLYYYDMNYTLTVHHPTSPPEEQK